MSAPPPASSSRVPPGPTPGPPPGAPPGPPPGRPPMAFPGPPPGGPQMYGVPPGGFGMPAYPPAPPAFVPPPPPPLPAGWTEHRAPDGVTPYYYNGTTKQSTYIRPLPGLAAPGLPAHAAPPAAEKKKKKEKPRDKVAVPGTGWVRVTTTEGNVFYFEKESKRSEWSVPDEIKDGVAQLEAEEKAARAAEEAERKKREEEERLERLREAERVRAEVEEERRRKAEARDRKRKADAEGREQRAKAARVDEESGVVGEDEDGAGDGDGDGAPQFAPDDEEDEAAWMRAVAAEFATADAAVAAEQQRTAEETKRDEEEAARQVFAAPGKVVVAPEEGRALFKALLYEKDISPFAPWDASLPLFINDPRYILLSSMKERQEVFDEYCRDVGRARRLGKSKLAGAGAGAGAGGAGSASPSAPAAAEGAEKKADPGREYRALMREHVTSTRARWEDFRRAWKRDRRFYAFGRDDREREKAFKVHLRELGERKRADAQRAETDFFELLAETDIAPGAVWSAVKRGISHDPRYDAVGSSSLREELFNLHTKKLAAAANAGADGGEDAEARRAREKREKGERSLREREQRVRAEQERVESEVGKSREGAGREEAERLFGSLLVDAIREEMSYAAAVDIIGSDARFNHPALRPGDKQRLFAAHTARLAARRGNALAALFAAHTPALDTPFSAVYAAVADDALVARLGLAQAPAELEARWDGYMRDRRAAARAAFDGMLGENSFVEFWGRMRKKQVDEHAAKIAADDRVEVEEIQEDADGPGRGLVEMAQAIDLDEIKAVLRRYRQFDHIPEEREQWLRDYLENLDAARGSQTIHAVNTGY